MTSASVLRVVNRWWACEGSLKIEAATAVRASWRVSGCQDGGMTEQRA
jgi:hypothetical protein